jgi:alkyl hydroperoxide reductase subunit AhpF
MIAPVPAACDFGFASCASSAEECATDMVKANPTLSMLVVFGVGVGVGAIVAEAVTSSHRASRSENIAERIGRQICETLNIKF